MFCIKSALHPYLISAIFEIPFLCLEPDSHRDPCPGSKLAPTPRDSPGPCSKPKHEQDLPTCILPPQIPLFFRSSNPALLRLHLLRPLPHSNTHQKRPPNDRQSDGDRIIAPLLCPPSPDRAQPPLIPQRPRESRQEANVHYQHRTLHRPPNRDIVRLGA